MKLGKTYLTVAAVAALLAAAPKPGSAQVISFDEYGNIIVQGIPGFVPVRGLAADPISGLVTLFYSLPAFAITSGDVVLFELPPTTGCDNFPPNFDRSGCSDVLRFYGPGSPLPFNAVFVFSDALGLPEPGVLADGPLPPQPVIPWPTFFTPEMGVEGNNGLFGYTPVAGLPGGTLGPILTYNFVSDGALPEPGSLVLTGTGLAALAGYMRRRRRAKSFGE